MPTDLFTRFALTARSRPHSLALRVRDGAVEAQWTYERLFAEASALASGFAASGLQRGDRVAFLCGNRPEFVVGYLAVLSCGAAMMPINLSYRRREVAHMVADAAPCFAFGGREQLAVLDDLEPAERASLECIVAIEDLDTWKRPLAAGDEQTFSAVEPSNADDLALLLYTSGTTGRSKGAEITHGNVGAMIDALHTAWEWSAADVLLLTLPLFHMHGLVVGLHCALAAGASVLLERSFEAGPAIERLARGEASLFFGVPTIYVRLVEELERRRAAGEPVEFPGVRLFVSGSAPLAPETFTAFKDLTGQDILERYGMTETGMLLSNPLRGERRPGTVGRPLPGVEMRLAGGGTVEGEVQVRGPNVFRGYRNASEKTAESFVADPQGGAPWFRTGDLGRLDPATGAVTLLGRSSELILSGGFNVYPREVEEVLLAFPDVREAAVTGERNQEWGESPIAYLVCSPGLDVEALSAHCRRELAPFKLPRRFVLVDALPRNALGKVEKRRLGETVQSNAPHSR